MPGVGIYKKMKSTPKKTKDKLHTSQFSSTRYTRVHSHSIIKEMDNSLTYIPDHVADELVNNLIKFMDEHPSTEIIFEEEKSEEDMQIHPNTTRNKFPI